MSSLDRGPRQLAEAVLRALSLAVVDMPMPTALALFFDVLYEVSFRTERGTMCSFLWQESPAFPPSFSSAFALGDATENPCRSYIPFAAPLPFSVSGVLALLKALEPGRSAMAVYGAEGQAPIVHGLVNYGAESARLCPAEWETQAGVCGSFLATVLGPAHITVEAGLDYPIELKRNSLRAHAHSVLRRGPLRERLSAALSDLSPAAVARLAPDKAAASFLEATALPLRDGSVVRYEFEWGEVLERLWLDTLTRLLLKIRENAGGGAVLVTPHAAGSAERDQRVQIPYGLEYSTLRGLLEERGAFWMQQFIHAAKALSEQPRTVQEMHPDELALPEPDPRTGPPGNDLEIAQAIAFIAALAGMDGILLLTPQLEATGFGGRSVEENSGKSAAQEVYLAGNELAAEAGLSAVPGHAFGPRCQALIRQCGRDPDAIGFFLTQDGELRAMMQHTEKIIVWDPVRLNRE